MANFVGGGICATCVVAVMFANFVVGAG